MNPGILTTECAADGAARYLSTIVDATDLPSSASESSARSGRTDTLDSFVSTPPRPRFLLQPPAPTLRLTRCATEENQTARAIPSHRAGDSARTRAHSSMKKTALTNSLCFYTALYARYLFIALLEI